MTKKRNSEKTIRLESKSKKTNPSRLKTSKTKSVSLNESDIFIKLQPLIPKVVSNTVKRYENGHYATIFNWSDMSALAEDTALEVVRRVKIRLDDPLNPEGVDLKGAYSYFKTAFKNQCLKIYEKYAKTDIRAGVQTFGSDEAMAVATSRNLYSPEDSYLLEDQIKMVREALDRADKEYNRYATAQAERFGHAPTNQDKQHFLYIFQSLLDGLTAEEVEKNLKIPNADYLRQKRLMCDYIRGKFPLILKDMQEHFESPEDHRIYVRDVNKRQKLKQAIKDFKPKFLFYVHTVVKDKNVEGTLYARIELYDRFDNKTNKVPPKLVKLKSLVDKNNPENFSKIKDLLWQETKLIKTQGEVEKLAQEFLNEVKNKIAS